jgi:hypothetical protein
VWEGKTLVKPTDAVDVEAQESDSDFTEVLYKYTDYDGAEKTLANRTLKFTRASEFNDPFDIYIADLFGMDVEEFLDEADRAWLDADPIKARVQRLSTDQIEQLKELVLADPRRQAMVTSLKRQNEEFAASFMRCGVFCATKTFSDLLMWAHYADKHRGAVLGFLPDIEKDSVLRLTRPVRYQQVRPSLMKHPKQHIEDGLPRTPPDAGKQINRAVLYTKSSEWSYEKEVRLTLREYLLNGETESFNPFYPNELVEVYLGYRTTLEQKNRIADLARNLNPEVKVFTASLAKRRFALEFRPFVQSMASHAS